MTEEQAENAPMQAFQFWFKVADLQEDENLRLFHVWNSHTQQFVFVRFSLAEVRVSLNTLTNEEGEIEQVEDPLTIEAGEQDWDNKWLHLQCCLLPEDEQTKAECTIFSHDTKEEAKGDVVSSFAWPQGEYSGKFEATYGTVQVKDFRYFTSMDAGNRYNKPSGEGVIY